MSETPMTADLFRDVLGRMKAAVSDTPPEFSVRPVYDPHTDSLMVYLADVPSYAKDCGNGVVVLLAANDSRVVGVEISGIARSVADAAQRMIHGRTPTIHWPTIH